MVEAQQRADSSSKPQQSITTNTTNTTTNTTNTTTTTNTSTTTNTTNTTTITTLTTIVTTISSKGASVFLPDWPTGVIDGEPIRSLSL
jgi:hypothetical protein